jgi:drug/metabolite transporter (DMT)-like permease
MSFVPLTVAVLGATFIWPVNRWVMHHQGRAPVYSFWTSVTAAITSAMLALLTGQSFDQPVVWTVGAIIGLAYALGYCLIVMYCLKIGPTAPTVAINNMGLVWPIVVSAFWPKQRSFNGITILGLILVCFSLILWGQQTPKVSIRWARWAFFAWILAGISMTGQFIGNVYASDSPFVLTCIYTATAAIILALPALCEVKKRFEIREMVAGVVNGIMLALTMFVILGIILYRFAVKK